MGPNFLEKSQRSSPSCLSSLWVCGLSPLSTGTFAPEGSSTGARRAAAGTQCELGPTWGWFWHTSSKLLLICCLHMCQDWLLSPSSDSAQDWASIILHGCALCFGPAAFTLVLSNAVGHRGARMGAWLGLGPGLGRHRKLPIRFLCLVLGVSQSVCALHEWTLGFLLPHCQFYWFSNHLRRRILPGLDPRVECPVKWFEPLAPQGRSLNLCDAPTLLCPLLRTQVPNVTASLTFLFHGTWIFLTVLAVEGSFCQFPFSFQWDLLHV